MSVPAVGLDSSSWYLPATTTQSEKKAKTAKQAAERRTHHVVELSVAGGDNRALHIVDRINELVRDGQNLSIRPVDYAKALAPHSSQSRLHLLTDFDVLIRTLGLLAGYVCYVLKSRRVLDVGLDLPNNTAECARSSRLQIVTCPILAVTCQQIAKLRQLCTGR